MQINSTEEAKEIVKQEFNDEKITKTAAITAFAILDLVDALKKLASQFGIST